MNAKTAIAYLHVVGRSDPSAPAPEYYAPWSIRFIESYRKFIGPTPHDLVVISCGAERVADSTRELFPEATRFLAYAGGGWDIGAHQQAMLSLQEDYEFVIAMATPTYLWRPGFLEKMLAAFEAYGDGLFGPTASYQVSPHIRTCCWACRPKSFADYPVLVDTRPETFRAESGNLSISRWFESRCKPVIMVAASGTFERSDWRKPPNIFRRGDQSNCLVWDRHTDIYRAGPALQRDLEKLANGHPAS